MKLFFIMSLFISQSFAASVDLKKANNYEQNGEYKKAAQIYTSCLKAQSANQYSNLEKCLTMGEEFGVRLAEKITNQALLETSGKSMDKWKGLRDYKKMGLDFKFDTTTYIFTYQNEFSNKFKILFSSKDAEKN